MTTDDIARILAALHDITPEKVRAVIEGAEKLRGLWSHQSPPSRMRRRIATTCGTKGHLQRRSPSIYRSTGARAFLTSPRARR